MPLTGGALAKLAAKGPSATAWPERPRRRPRRRRPRSCCIPHPARAIGGEGRAASPRRVLSWLALAVAAMLVPWLIYPAVGGDLAGAFAAGALWDAIWPMLVGAALAAGLWALGDPLPRVPAGDILVAEEAAFHAVAPLGACSSASTGGSDNGRQRACRS